jgi:hypothetical protein
MIRKNLLFTLLWVTVLLAPAAAMADGIRAGAQLSSGSTYGSAVGARVEYDADLKDTGKLTLALAVDNFFPDLEGERYYEVNVHLLYTFYDGEMLDGYAGGGLGFNRHKDTSFIPPAISKSMAINALLGCRVATGTQFVPFAEFRADLAGQYVVTAGVLYTIK